MTSLGSRRWWVLGALVVILLAVSLDLTALNVALPTLSSELHASTGALQWIVASYTLVSATLLIPAGPARRPVRPQEDAARRPDAVPGWPRCSPRRLQPGRADRRPHAHGRRLGGHHAARHVGAAGASSRREEQRQGARRVDRRVVPRPAARPDHRRLAARPLLVGLDLLHQHAGRGGGAGARPRADPGVPRPPRRPASTSPALLLSTGGLIALVVRHDPGRRTTAGASPASGASWSPALSCSPPSWRWTRRVRHGRWSTSSLFRRPELHRGRSSPPPLMTFAHVRVLFVAPQYFQAVLGTRRAGLRPPAAAAHRRAAGGLAG